MRVLLNGMPVAGRITGIGRYGLHLLHALNNLPDAPDLEAIGVFDGRGVVEIDRFLGTAAESRGPGRLGWVRDLLRRGIPRGRDVVDFLRSVRLARHTSGRQWSLYHETNFVPSATNVPMVATVHDMGYVRYPAFMPPDRLRWMRRRMEWTLHRARVVLADSEFTRRELIELCPAVSPDRVFVAPMGVDVDFFRQREHASRIPEVLDRYNLPPRFLLYLGTLEPRKNVQGLARAYSLLPLEMQKEYPLVLAGMRGWQQRYFRREIEQLRSRGVLHEIGYVEASDVPVLMKAASVFCFPSFYEGFGLPPLEAAACGTAVLASHAASLPEVLGDAAVYADPSSPEEIAHQLQTLLDDKDLRESFAARGPAQAAQFTWNRCAQQTLKAYRAAA